MDYNIVMTESAEKDLDHAVNCLLFTKKNEQAAGSLLNDFEITTQVLSRIAGSLKLCDNETLRREGYRRINFQTHRYFLLYRIENNDVIIDAMFHELEDYENRMI